MKGPGLWNICTLYVCFLLYTNFTTFSQQFDVPQTEENGDLMKG